MKIEDIKHLSIVGELTINLASLNNEGTEGSATQPRTAVVVRDKKLYTVPAISGDMVKHWHAQHLATIAQERKLPLCFNVQGRSMNPNRLKGELASLEWLVERFPEAATWGNSDSVQATDSDDQTDAEEDGSELEEDVEDDTSDEDAAKKRKETEKKEKDAAKKKLTEKKQKLERELYRLLASECLVTDAHGLLLTVVDNKKVGEGGFKMNVAVPRTGRVQFGIMAGIPEISHIQHYFHAKFVSARSGVQARENASNEGQNIFTRPASSAVFAFVSVIDLAGLGWDDAENKYAVDETERTKRKQAVIDAMSYTLMHQPGANTSQQFPHVMDFKGAIVLSTSRCPAPTVSPLTKDFQATLEGLVENINRMNDDKALTFYKVSGISETVGKLTDIAHGEKVAEKSEEK